MCGVVGAISAAPIDPKLVAEMRDRLAHRGPDHAGLWLAEDSRVCLGHRRLGIVDLSPEANQPLISHDGRFVITFNGEIYNFQSLRLELAAEGVSFYTQSDTEVLVEAFRRWGERCLSHLSGMFAFAIWDRLRRRLFCARDRVGEKPFYYAKINDSFIFASELKALLPWPGFRRQIHYPALVDYLSFGFVVDPKTIWEGCHKLPPGHWMSVDIGTDGVPLGRDPMAYWDLQFNPDHSIDDWGPRILKTLETASQEMAFADVPVGAFLSGGVDSSSVTAALRRAGCSVNTFTVGFQEQDYDERQYAREVSQLYGTAHTEKVLVADDVEPVIQQLLWHFDEPFNDYSYLPTFYLCREARKHITVALSGDGGDEMFSGYRKYQRLAMRQNVQQLIPHPLIRLLGAGTQSLLSETSQLRKKLWTYRVDVRTLLGDMLITGFSFFALRAAARGPLAHAIAHYRPLDAIMPLLQKAPPDEVGLVNSMRYLDLKLTLAGDMLVKVDRASMAVSLEVRPVYLHRDMISLAEKIPPSLLADRNQSKKVLKTALRSWLPDSILFRKKMGLAMPLKNWINGGLEALILRDHDGSLFEDLLDSTLLRKMARIHASGKTDFTSCIHSLFFLKHWLAKWV